MHRMLRRKTVARCFHPIFCLITVICFGPAGADLAAAGQDPPPYGAPPYGDKHIGGDVPTDERMAEATKRGRRALERPPEDRVLKSGPLAVAKQDRAVFASFLRTPNTGLIRLLPPGNRTYLGAAPMAPNDQCYYSFANLTHFIGYGSDIVLRNDQLAVGVLAFGYGMLTNIGDVPLEQIALSDQRARSIADYKPAVTLEYAREEVERFRNPVILYGGRYQSALPVEVNFTYLLRSINYGKALSGSMGWGRTPSIVRRTDVLVAFRVIRRDPDGGVTIAWKLLKRFPAPNLEGKR
jgi:hypothetical protein